MLYKKRPVTIEAFQLGTCEPYPQWFEDAIFCKWVTLGIDSDGKTCALIRTLEGTHYASPGDYIIKGVAGELYPCKPDIFKATYEKVEE